jgi:hypothetical protein
LPGIVRIEDHSLLFNLFEKSIYLSI